MRRASRTSRGRVPGSCHCTDRTSLQFLETFASLCCEDVYLSNILSSCGISFANLPARESILFWPFVGRATEILQSRYVAISQFLNSGGVAADSTVGRLVNELDSALFRSHCRYLHALVATVAEKIVELAEAVDLSGSIVVLVDLLNWFQDQLTTDGPCEYSKRLLAGALFERRYR